MRHDGGSLGDQQTVPRCRREHTPPFPLLHDGLVILFRFEAENGKPEAALTRDRFCMAGTRIAPRLGEDGLDIIDETQRTHRLGREAWTGKHHSRAGGIAQGNGSSELQIHHDKPTRHRGGFSQWIAVIGIGA